MHTIYLNKGDSIAKAFDLSPGIISLVGGGGKTTLMLALANSLSQTGARVIVTTTTHILPPDGMITYHPGSLKEAETALYEYRFVCFGKPAQEGKLSAPDLSIAALKSIADYILVEADGAKRLPLKAPAEHEPVIPAESNFVLAVAGLDGAGQPIHETAFRPERYAALCGKTQSDIVTPADIARVLAHENGQRKGLPPDARFAVLLNKADDETRVKIARETATELEQYGIDRVVIAALGGE